jgi:pilus assembly protein CpaB
MNRNRLMVGLGVAVVVAFFASIFVYRQLEQASLIRPVAMQQIVVANAALPLGTRLTASNVKLMPWPTNDSIPGTLNRVEDAVDRAVITQVAPNEPILEAKLAPRSAGAGLPATIPQGMRAVSVAVNDVVDVAGFVTPGTSVDVLVTGQVPGATQGGSDNVTRVILENVRVLAAGQKIEQDRDGKPATVPVVTLLVLPEDAARLTMASTEGKIQLALRNTIDDGTAMPDPVMQASLFGGGVAPAPAKPVEASTHRAAAPKIVVTAPSPYTVEIITGDKRETKSFPNGSSASSSTPGSTPSPNPSSNQ